MGTPSRGTAFTDGGRIGNYANAEFSFGALGIPVPSRARYKFRPQSSESIFGGNSGSVISAAGAITLTASPPQIPSVSFQGYTNVLELDVPRGLVFIIQSGTLAAPITFTISGWDGYFHKVVEKLTISSGATANSYPTKKTYKYIKSIYASAGSGSVPFTILSGSHFGVPYYIPHQTWSLNFLDGAPDYGANITAASGTYYLQAPHATLGTTYQTDKGCFVVGDATFPATATTGDPRGVYYPNPNIYGGNTPLDMELDMYVVGFDTNQGTYLSPNAPAPSKEMAYGVEQYAQGWQ